MSSGAYVVTPNSVKNPLNQSPQTVFVTQGIDDPIVQQNFDSLNKFLAKRLTGKEVEQANYVVGPAFAFTTPVDYVGTTERRIGALQAQITTRGNPVRLKIAPFFNGTGISNLSLLSGVTNPDNASMTGGWVRINSLGQQTVISRTSLGMQAKTSTVGIVFAVPLPAFEFEDVVPSGVYTYQFYFKAGLADTDIFLFNLNVVAYELR